MNKKNWSNADGEKMKKQTGVISFLTILCFLLVIWLPCQAADDSLYVCKNNKTGAPRLVKAPNLCKAKTEYLVTLTSGTQGPTGPTGAQGPQGAQGPSSGAKVYDAADQSLGIFLETIDTGEQMMPAMKILIEELKREAVIDVFTGELALGGFSYESTDCTGTPYIRAMDLYKVVKGSAGKYYTGTYMQPFSITVNSFFQGDCFHSPGYSDAGVVATEVTLPFTTPVALPMRLE
jgi:hypothetical protein